MLRHKRPSATSGTDPLDDAQVVADWGASFPNAAGDALFGITAKEKS